MRLDFSISKQRITYRCAHCGEPIEDGDGFLQPDMRYTELGGLPHRGKEGGPATPKGAAFGIRASDIPASDALTLDQHVAAADRHPAARWQAVHRHCDTLGDDAYHVKIEEYRTVRSIVALLLHVCQKSWGKHTDTATTAVRILLAGVGLDRKPRVG